MSDSPDASEASRPVPVGGAARRVAILTVGLQPPACYLARRLRSSGAEILLLNQARLRVEPGSLEFFRRLYRRRGPWICLDALLLHGVKTLARLPSRLLGRRGDRESGEASVPALAADPGVLQESWLRFFEIADVNRSPDQDLLRSLEPDLMLLAGAPILTRATIEIARVACLNPHCGISPAYAGSSPFDWAILEGRFEEIGYTIHLAVPTVDAGPILHQERVAWDPRRSNSHLWPVLAQRMYDRLADVALDLIRGRTLLATPQEEARVRPPAGLVVRLLSEMRRLAYARRRSRGAVATRD